MTGLHYPDNLYADALGKIRAATQKPTGAYRSTDPVTKPAHYQRAGIETIDYIRATLDAPGFEAYCIGNVLKYVSRYREKGGIEDLRKAQVYLGWAIEPKPAADAGERKDAGDRPLCTKEEWAEWRLGCAMLGMETPEESPKVSDYMPEGRAPKWDPAWGLAGQRREKPPMHAETLRDHGERLQGPEDAL